MKKIILFILSFLFAFVSIAQLINKGEKLFGGSFSFSVFEINSNGPGYNSGGNAGIFPSFAWVIRNDVALGIRGAINYGYTGIKPTSTDKTENNTFGLGVGVFVRKYKLLKNKFGLYFNNEASANYGVDKRRQTGGGISTSSSSHSWGGMYSFQPGVFYKFSEYFFGEGSIGGLFAYYYGDGVTKNFGLGASFLQYFNLGINYRIERKSRNRKS